MSDTGGTFDVNIPLNVALTALNNLGPELAKILKREMRKGFKGLDLGPELTKSIEGAMDKALPGAVRKMSNRVAQELGASSKVTTTFKKAGAAAGKAFAASLEVTGTKDGVAAVRAMGRAIERAAERDITLGKQGLARVRSANRTKVQIARAPGLNALDKAEAEANKARVRADEQIRVQAARRADRVAIIDRQKAAREQAAAQRSSLRQQEQDQAASQARSLARTRRHTRLLTIASLSALDFVRDRRRISARQELADESKRQREQDRALRTAQLRSRAANATALIEARNFAKQRASTFAQIEARTASGVIGALRGTSFLGGALRRAFFAGGGALLFGSLIDQAEDFNASLQFLQGLTGATASEMDRLSKKAIDLGKDITLPGVSATDAAEALAQLVRSGLSVEQAMDSARGALILARTQSVDFAQAAKLVGQELNIFNLRADQTGEAIDVIIESIRRGGGQTFSELETALRQAAPAGAIFAKAIDQSTGAARGGLGAFADLSAAVALLAKNGQNASIGGTQVQRFILRLLNPTQKATAVFGEAAAKVGALSGDIKQLTINADGTLKTLPEIITNFNRFFKTFTEAEKLEIFGQLFGDRAFRAAVVFSQQTEESLKQLFGLEEQATSLANRLAAAINRGPRAAFEAFSSVVESLFTQGYNLIRLPVSKFFFGLASAVDALFTSTEFTQVRGALLGIAGGLSSVIAGRGAIQVLGALRAAAFGLASPIGILSAAAGGLGAAVSLGVRNSVDFKVSLLELGDAITEDLLPALGRAGETVAGFFGGGTAAARGRSFFDTAAQVIVSRFIPGVKLAALAIDTRLIPPLEKLPTFLRDDLAPALASLPPLIREVFDLLVLEGQNLAERTGFADFVGDAQIAARTALEGVRQALRGDTGAAGETFRNLGNAIRDNISEALDGIPFGDIFSDIVRRAGNALEASGKFITRTLFSAPVLRTAVALGAGAVAVGIEFAKGLVKGIVERRGDIARVIGETLLAAAKLAVSFVFSSPLATLVASAFAAAFAFKNFRRIADNIIPVFELIRTRTVQGFTQSLDEIRARQLATTQEVARAASQRAAQFGPSFVGRVAQSISAASGRFEQLGATAGQRFALAAGAAASAAFAGFAGGQQGGLGGGLLAGLTGALGSLTLAASGVALPLAALPVALAGLGFAFGNARREAQEAAERVKAFGDALRSEKPFVDAFADGIGAIADRDKGLAAALAQTGIGVGQVLEQIAPGGRIAVADALDALRDDLNALINDAVPLRDVPNLIAQLRDSGLVAAPQIERLDAAFGRLDKRLQPGAVREVNAAIDDIAKSIGVAGPVLDQFGDLVDEVLAGSREALVDESIALDVERLTEAIAKARVEGEGFRTAIVGAIPSNLRNVIELQLLQPLDGVVTAVLGSEEAFQAFLLSLAGLEGAAALKPAELDAIRYQLTLLRDAAAGSTGAMAILREELAKDRRSERLERIREQWRNVTSTTQDAIDKFREYVNLQRPQTFTKDTFFITAVEGFRELKQLQDDLTAAGGNARVINALDNEAGARFRLQADQVKRELGDQLATVLAGTPPDQLVSTLNAFIAEATRAAAAEGFDARIIDIEEFLLGLLPPDVQAALRDGWNAVFEQVFQHPELIIDGRLNLDAAPEELRKIAEENPLLIEAVIKEVEATRNEFQVGLKATAAELAALPLPLRAAMETGTLPIDVKPDVVAADLMALPSPLRAAMESGSMTIDVTLRLKPGELQRIQATLGVPGMADGGVVSRPTFTAIGEGGKPEAVIPLTKPQRALELMRATGLDRLAMTGDLGSLRTAGTDLGLGAAIGISQSRGIVAQATAGLANVVSSTFTRLLGIHSPSTVFQRFGRDIIAGLVQGLREGAQAASGAIQDFIGVLLGRLPEGGVATGFEQLAEAVRQQLTDDLKVTDLDEFRERAQAQSEALNAITDLAKSKGDFRKGLGLDTAAGAQNRARIADVVQSAREAIVEAVASGDESGAEALLAQLQAALAKVSGTNRGNAAVIEQILGAAGLGGSDPIQGIVDSFTNATEELRRLIEAEEQRAAERAALDTPSVSVTFNNDMVVQTDDPLLAASRVAREQQRQIARALGR